MNLLILDIDGVLYTSNHFTYASHLKKDKTRDKYGFLFDPKCVANLNEITDKTNAKIVISSTWRLKGLEFLKNCFKDRGITGEIIGLTPIGTIDNIYICRGEEIEQWLIEHGIPDNLAIIDDNSLGYPYDSWKFFYKTNMRTGITDDIKNDIINKFTEL